MKNTAFKRTKFEREQCWMREHQLEYIGQWVALDADRLLSHGESLQQVYADAKAKGLESPFTGYVDPLDVLLFGGW